MIRTAFTDFVGIEHPIVSAGMGGGHTGGELVGRVSGAGGLGVLGATFVPVDELAAMVQRARELTSKPIGINLLLHATDDRVDEVLGRSPRCCRRPGHPWIKTSLRSSQRRTSTASLSCTWSRGSTRPSADAEVVRQIVDEDEEVLRSARGQSGSAYEAPATAGSSVSCLIRPATFVRHQ